MNDRVTSGNMTKTDGNTSTGDLTILPTHRQNRQITNRFVKDYE